MALYQELEKDGARKVFSHNDLHQKNLLWNNEILFPRLGIFRTKSSMFRYSIFGEEL